MKNLYFLIFFFFVFAKSYSQRDVIFWLDNSGSISGQEWMDMTTSIHSLMNEVLDCNPNNRIAVVHYGGYYNNSGFRQPRIYIEDPNGDGAFTGDINEAIDYSRRDLYVSGGDFAHETLGLIGDALDEIPNPLIFGDQDYLDYDTSHNLVIYLFTDAERGRPTNDPLYPGTSYLINLNNTDINSNAAFTNYTDFKNNRNATFVVTSVNPANDDDENLLAQNAKAAISSYSDSGNYNGTIENYPAEPDGNQLPRMYLNSANFNISAVDLNIITSDLCNCPITLTLGSPFDDVVNAQENRQAEQTIFASNIIDSNSGAVYHAGLLVELNPGFEANSGAQFAAYIEGCSDDYLYRSQSLPIKDIVEITKPLIKVSITPNPSSNSIEITLNNSKFNKVYISSILGEIVLNKTIESSDSFEINISDYPRGIYTVTVVLIDGESYTGRLIKN